MAWRNNMTLGDVAKVGGPTLAAPTGVASYQTLKDINQINKWAAQGYGPGNKVPQHMLKKLTGAYVPNKIFEKLGYGKGSLKGWWNNTVSPTHFKPAQTVINPALRGIGKLVRGAISTPALGVYGTAKMAQAQGDEMMNATRIAEEADLNLEDYITRDGTRISIDDSLFFAPGNTAENKESFIFPEKKYKTSDVYDEIGQHSERRIQEKPFSPFSENYNYDKGTYLGIDNIDPQHLNIDTMHWDEKDRQNAIHKTYEPQEAQTWLEKHNAAQREYNRVAPGANVTPWGDSGNITSAAVQGRRNEDWMNSIIGNYTMGIGKQDVKQNLINKYGTVQQQQNFADAIARKTHNPYANYDYFEGQGVDRADITADVTGMYTDSGSSGMDDIGDVTTTESSSASVDDGWGDVDGVSYIARGGMVKDAPRYRYAEGGIVNLLPKGAW